MEIATRSEMRKTICMSVIVVEILLVESVILIATRQECCVRDAEQNKNSKGKKGQQ